MDFYLGFAVVMLVFVTLLGVMNAIRNAINKDF